MTRNGFGLLAAAALAVMLAPAPALAETCGQTGARAELQRLDRAMRQLGCRTASERTPQHAQCMQIAQERHRLMRAGHVRRLGCEPDRRTVVSRPRRSPVPDRNLALYCVRPSDGYYFPTPHSRYVARDEIDTALDRCRFICRDEAMRLFTLPDRSRETGEMVALDGGTPYATLPNAFAYRTSRDFRSCNHRRYQAAIETMRVTKDFAQRLAELRVPLPTPRPDPVAETATAVDADDPPNVSYETTASVSDDAGEAEPVRTVGPAFLPD